MPLYAVALDLPAEYFDKAFAEPQYTLRMTHYPFVEGLAENEFGIAPHGFVTATGVGMKGVKANRISLCGDGI